jgi:polynucleotide 5'-kinase involved in rRNA processing
LIKGINGYRIFRTATSNYVKKKSFEDRKEFRKQNILSYLESAKTLKLPLRKLRLKRCFLMSGKKQQIPEEFSTMILSVEKLEENEGYLIVLKKELNYDKLKAVKEFYGNKVRLIIAGEEKNIYVGLADETNKFIGVGFVEKIDYVKENIFIYSNIDAQLIKTVSFGILKINEKGEEIGFVKPGKF